MLLWKKKPLHFPIFLNSSNQRPNRHTFQYRRRLTIRRPTQHTHSSLLTLNIAISRHFTNSNSYATTHGFDAHVPFPETLSISEAKALRGVSNPLSVFPP